MNRLVTVGGVLTAVAPGRTGVVAEYQGRFVAREVTVLPSGTFVVKGRVSEPGNLPLFAARVEIVDGHGGRDVPSHLQRVERLRGELARGGTIANVSRRASADVGARRHPALRRRLRDQPAGSARQRVFATLYGSTLQFSIGDTYYRYFGDLVEQLDAATFLTINGFTTATATPSEASGVLKGTFTVWDAPNMYPGLARWSAAPATIRSYSRASDGDRHPRGAPLSIMILRRDEVQPQVCCLRMHAWTRRDRLRVQHPPRARGDSDSAQPRAADRTAGACRACA
jgi:hypothetical protein